VGSGDGDSGWAAVGGDSVGWVAVGGSSTGRFESMSTSVRRGWLRAFKYLANLQWPGSGHRKLPLIYVGPNRQS
jgi:hypothetical protein